MIKRGTYRDIILDKFNHKNKEMEKLNKKVVRYYIRDNVEDKKKVKLYGY